MTGEFELFEPVRRLFAEAGYKVNAEVKDCDVTAVKDGEFIIIELKRNLSVALLAQGLKRQKTGARVYVAVPKPKNYLPKKYRDVFYVLKKLELGLIFVTLRDKHSFAEAVFDPQEFFPPVSKNYKKRKAILSEIEGRAVETNTGGVTGKKIVTAYTEKCINIACILDTYGELSPKQVKDYGGDENCGRIMRINAYGWFEKVRTGVYRITLEGRKGLLEYPELEKYYTEKLLGSDKGQDNPF